ncbi:MAG: DUF2238 domain-containing protein [Pontibacterium sp.]
MKSTEHKPGYPVSLAWLSVYLLVLVWSGINPADNMTWLLEVLPAMVALIVLAATFQSHPLTPLVYLLILIQAVVLMIGGHYTYADVPVFEQIAALSGGRNNYDKLAHFIQGFVPAMVAREIILRTRAIPDKYWRTFFIGCFCLALSAFYELIEWWVALISQEAADSFLGTQGYIWDTQSDMFWALIGATIALLTLSAQHDRQLKKLSVPHPAPP